MATLTTLLPCASPMPDVACVEAFVRNKVARAFRRPLAETEVTDYMGLYRLGLTDGPAVGVRMRLEAVLQSPSFIWRTEFGANAPASGKVRLRPSRWPARLVFSF